MEALWLQRASFSLQSPSSAQTRCSSSSPLLRPPSSVCLAFASLPQPLAPLRPSPAEAARTLIDLCTEGTLCTSSVPDGWPFGTAVRFAVEPEDGLPIFRLHPSGLLSRHLGADCRCSLHIQMEQPGHRKPQCTFKGRVSRAENERLKQLQGAWEKRFGEELGEEDCLHFMSIENVLQSLDFGEEDVWVSNSDYKQATADPLREFAAKIVDDMNRNHWEDIRRFCNVYGHLDVLVEEARITWVDRLGFDMRVLTSPSHEIIEIRIPFSREVLDERDARSSLTMMAQIAWEYERNYNPPEVQIIGR